MTNQLAIILKKYFFGHKTQQNPYMAKSLAKKTYFFFANIANFRGPLCEIKMLTNCSTKQVPHELWQDLAWEHLRTMHVLS